MYREMVDKIGEVVASGKSISDVEPGDILTMNAAKIAKLKQRERAADNGGAGDHALRIAFQYVDGRDHYMKRGKGNTEQWVDEHTDHVILTTAGKRYRDTSTTAAHNLSLDATTRLHHRWNDAFKMVDKRALVTVNNNSDSPNVDWFNGNCRPGVIEVILPSSYTDDTFTVLGDEHRSATPDWQAVPAGAEYAEQDGVSVAAKYIVDGITYIRVFSAPTKLYDSAGKMHTLAEGDDIEVVRWTEFIAAFASGEIAAAGDDEPTQEDRDAYEAARMMIGMSRASIARSQDKLRDIQRKLDTHNDNIKEYMDMLVHRQREKAVNLKEKERLERETASDLASATGTLLSEFEKIIADPPVKTAKMFERGGDTIIAIELYPLVANTEEQKLDADGRWGAGRGPALYRLFDNLKFEMNISANQTHMDHIIKWIHPTGMKAGFDTRCHPHNFADGRSCWGQLSTPFAEAVGNMEWHTAVQWLFNYCANVRDDEPHHTKQWMFKPAPEGWTPGWVLPEMEEETEFLKTYDPEPTYVR